jgi:rRNA maturation RNase YbeY
MLKNPMANSIYFFSEDIKFNLKNKAEIKSWIRKIFADEGFKLDVVNFIFCSDEYLIKINREYLDHDTLTDIITFQYNKKGEFISSDIYISIERCTENATFLGQAFYSELHRLLAHGVLHLCGYKDKQNAHKIIMTQKEDLYLSLRPEILKSIC